ncbi:hypothetical protein TraAM80_01310 [Trypanosoma rangeli]|uniref:CSD domain-containing protein n=1 Tax=Trypanosoma rangeli TaxID=5698 RepID=A0A422NZ87_TRYRA|nr:uncharacterized protein TraAM80_01310 [Trypanosoma rangeli]RNF10749.1 hypothetical protein TraAM80_01310 [Trypanosoma rangeli]|eukprot:RNF10749.1 hypothetical protein TraAM80_01310 [Trypanosoma rangeli]
MFFHPSAWTPTCDFGGSQFIALGLPYKQPMGYPPPSAEMQVVTAPYPVNPPTPPSFTRSCSTASHPCSLSASHANATARNKGSCRGSRRKSSSSNQGSCEASPGQASGSGWGLSMQSSMSSPASSMGTPPVYFVLQTTTSQNPQLAAPPANIMALPPQAHSPPSRVLPQENGASYKLGEWYEGVVKRYNPMRSFGFLTATHHLKIISPLMPPLPPPQEQQTSTMTKADPPSSPTTAAAGLTQPMELYARNATHEELQAHVVRTPVVIGDIFVHQSYIQMQGFRALSIGDKVVFRVGVLPGKTAHQAVSVHLTIDSEKRETVTDPALQSVAESLVATEEKSTVQQPAEASAHTCKSLERLLQHVAMKQEGCEGEPRDDLARPFFALEPEVAREECVEGCSLPTPMFVRNFAPIGCNAAMDEQEPVPCTSEPIVLPGNDEVWDFLANFGGN